MKHILFLLALALVLGSAGCATDVGKAAAKQGVSTIRIEPRVEAPPMTYGIPYRGDLVASLAGATMQVAYRDELDRMAALMQREGIDVPGMVHDAATRWLGRRKDFRLTDDEAAPSLVITIEHFGFVNAVVTGPKVPFLVLKARLLDASGKSLWSGQAVEQDPTVRGAGQRWSAYEANPELLRQAWAEEIERMLRRLFPPA